jgi:hypothetical protein
MSAKLSIYQIFVIFFYFYKLLSLIEGEALADGGVEVW